MTTTTIQAPQIKQAFNPYLLDPFYGLLLTFEKLCANAKKKIRLCDIGKRREFEKLSEQFRETYERKKKEKTEYEAKIKNAPKRPGIPTTGKTCMFRKHEN